jgi:hypothetical protein
MKQKMPKGVIRSLKSKKDRQYNGQKKMGKRTNKCTLIYKTLQRKVKIGRQEAH